MYSVCFSIEQIINDTGGGNPTGWKMTQNLRIEKKELVVQKSEYFLPTDAAALPSMRLEDFFAFRVKLLLFGFFCCHFIIKFDNIITAYIFTSNVFSILCQP